MRHIGLWIPHETCPGGWTPPPSIQTRMNYTVSVNPAHSAGCTSNILIENAALASNENAQLTIGFTIFGPGSKNLYLSLAIGSTVPFMPSVFVDGNPISFSTGIYSGTYGIGGHTLSFAINPSGFGSAAAGVFSLSGYIT